MVRVLRSSTLLNDSRCLAHSRDPASSVSGPRRKYRDLPGFLPQCAIVGDPWPPNSTPLGEDLAGVAEPLRRSLDEELVVGALAVRGLDFDLDIAGSGMTSTRTPLHVGGGTGVGVRLLTEWAKARCS